MLHRLYLPQSPHSVFDHFREVKSSYDNEEISVFTAPQGLPVLLMFINPGSIKNYEGVEKGVLVGMQTKFNITSFNKDFHVLGIQLKPYGIRQLFNIDAHLLTNKYINLEEFPIADKLNEAASIIASNQPGAAQKIESLLNNLPQYPVSKETTRFIEAYKENQSANISELIQMLGISERTLERKFKIEIGMSPKKYIRILRIINITRILEKQNEWMTIVADHDFTDQSHFIKEFKDIIKLTPVSFIQQRLRLDDQVPGPQPFDA